METLTKEHGAQVAQDVTPEKIMQIGMGFWASKTVLTAVNLGLFTELATGALHVQEIGSRLKLHPRGIYDFLDTLVALGFLERSGLKETAEYANSADANLFLDKKKKSYVGGILERANNRLYQTWEYLEQALLSGEPQNLSQMEKDGQNVYDAIYENPQSLRKFVRAMDGVQGGNFIAFARQFDFSGYKTLCDMGGSGALLSAQVVINNPHMKCVSYDLSKVSAIAKENIEAMHLQTNIEIQSGDFFKEEFPKADVITMGNILHNHSMEKKQILIGKAYDALPKGGALVIIENIIDNDRRQNAFGLMMSLNMILETTDGQDFTGADFDALAKDKGFTETFIMPLAGPSSAAIAIK